MNVKIRGNLIPFHSTHFKCVFTEKDSKGVEWLYTTPLIKGKVYSIIEWRKGYRKDSFSFRDERGQLWEWVDFWGVEDVSFEENLKTILK